MSGCYPYRPGNIIAMFCGSPSFNFDGGPAVRRLLRKIRDDGKIGKIFHVTFKLIDTTHRLHPEREDIKATRRMGKTPPSGYASRMAWHANAADIKALALILPFRCPRCWSSDRPYYFNFDSRTIREIIESGKPILCDKCNRMDKIRGINEFVALEDLAKSFTREVIKNGRYRIRS